MKIKASITVEGQTNNQSFAFELESEYVFQLYEWVHKVCKQLPGTAGVLAAESERNERVNAWINRHSGLAARHAGAYAGRNHADILIAICEGLLRESVQ